MTFTLTPLLALGLAPLQPSAAPLLAQASVAAPPAHLAQANTVGASAPTSGGRFLLGGRGLQVVQLEQISYFGDCPGEEQPELRDLSFLAAAPPAPYQRILIQNQTTGGYTDREYDERRPSAQTFAAALGQGQRGSFLTLAPGLNSFSYQVRQRLQNRTVDQGTANLEVVVNRSSRNRNFQEIREELYCSGDRSRTSPSELSACPNGLVTVERIGICPGGRRTTLSLDSFRSGGYGPGSYGGGAYPQGGYQPGGWGGGSSGSGTKPKKPR
jgi:hypothetical protein